MDYLKQFVYYWNFQQFKSGEIIYAKWKNQRYYMARIISVNTNGSYEVLFYDGVKKKLQAIDLTKIVPEDQEQVRKGWEKTELW